MIWNRCNDNFMLLALVRDEDDEQTKRLIQAFELLAGKSPY